MSAAIFARQVRYIKLGWHGTWEKECVEQGTIRLGFGTENPGRFHLCKSRNWNQLRTSLLDEGNRPGKATEFTNVIRSFFEDEGTTLWITFYADHMYWGFLDPDPPERRSDVGIWRTVANGWKCEDLRGMPLNKRQLSRDITKLAGFPGTSCEVHVADYVIRRINAVTRTSGNAPHERATKKLLSRKPTEGNQKLPVKDERDIERLQQALTITSRRLHNKLTNKLRELLTDYAMLEGIHSDAMFDVLVNCFDGKNNLLIEAKSSLDVSHVRMAVGQLFDYWFRLYGATKAHLAILIPDRPDDTTLQMLEWLGIGVLWLKGNQLLTSTKWRRHLAEE